jgi:hypothetical protein
MVEKAVHILKRGLIEPFAIKHGYLFVTLLLALLSSEQNLTITHYFLTSTLVILFLFLNSSFSKCGPFMMPAKTLSLRFGELI